LSINSRLRRTFPLSFVKIRKKLSVSNTFSVRIWLTWTEEAIRCNAPSENDCRNSVRYNEHLTLAETDRFLSFLRRQEPRQVADGS